MNREQAKRNLPFIQAFAEGKELQVRGTGGTWITQDSFMFSGGEGAYRIKPDPRAIYRIEVQYKHNDMWATFSTVSDPASAEQQLKIAERYTKDGHYKAARTVKFVEQL